MMTSGSSDNQRYRIARMRFYGQILQISVIARHDEGGLLEIECIHQGVQIAIYGLQSLRRRLRSGSGGGGSDKVAAGVVAAAAAERGGDGGGGRRRRRQRR